MAFALVLAVLAIYVPYGEAVLLKIRRYLTRRRDGRTLLLARDSFRHQVSSFESFLLWDSESRSPYSILFQESRHEFAVIFGDATLVTPTILRSVWTRVVEHARCLEHPEDVELAIADFHMVPTLFWDYQLLPIYQNCSDSVRRVASPALLSKLNAARDEYAHFLRQYIEWLRELNRKLNGKILPYMGTYHVRSKVLKKNHPQTLPRRSGGAPNPL